MPAEGHNAKLIKLLPPLIISMPAKVRDASRVHVEIKTIPLLAFFKSQPPQKSKGNKFFAGSEIGATHIAAFNVGSANLGTYLIGSQCQGKIIRENNQKQSNPFRRPILNSEPHPLWLPMRCKDLDASGLRALLWEHGLPAGVFQVPAAAPKSQLQGSGIAAIDDRHSVAGQALAQLGRRPPRGG